MNTQEHFKLSDAYILISTAVYGTVGFPSWFLRDAETRSSTGHTIRRYKEDESEGGKAVMFNNNMLIV